VHQDYQEALASAGLEALDRRIANGELGEIRIERVGRTLYVHAQGRDVNDQYLIRIEFGAYPIEPYEVGFLNPRALREDWERLSDRDPRYWPLSALPALHGSFQVRFSGAIPVFWCERATAPFFYYHGRKARWDPLEWPLDRLVLELLKAIKKADHPRHWRPVYATNLRLEALRRGAVIPDGAGVDDE
jgi:hypothetical protein